MTLYNLIIFLLQLQHYKMRSLKILIFKYILYLSLIIPNFFKHYIQENFCEFHLQLFLHVQVNFYDLNKKILSNKIEIYSLIYDKTAHKLR